MPDVSDRMGINLNSLIYTFFICMIYLSLCNIFKSVLWKMKKVVQKVEKVEIRERPTKKVCYF